MHRLHLVIDETAESGFLATDQLSGGGVGREVPEGRLVKDVPLCHSPHHL